MPKSPYRLDQLLHDLTQSTGLESIGVISELMDALN